MVPEMRTMIIMEMEITTETKTTMTTITQTTTWITEIMETMEMLELVLVPVQVMESAP
jgi:hypothetical protein